MQKLFFSKGKHYVEPNTKIGENPAHLNLLQAPDVMNKQKQII